MIKLDNTFRVPLPVQETWDLLTDLPRVASCLPGAELTEVVEGEYRGGLKAKIGPINARYQGSASFVEQDEVGHRAVINARGREEKGGGSASATITAVLQADGNSATAVHVSTALAISGRAAQFGRSLLAEVSATMVEEFVRRLEAMISSGESATPSPAPGSSGPAASATTRQAAIPAIPSSAQSENTLDVGTTIVVPLLRRAAVPLGSALIGMALGGLLVRRRGGSPQRPIGYVFAQAAGESAAPLPVYRRP